MKTVLITGCSSGFGLLLAVNLCRDYCVYASVRTPEKAKELLAQVEQKGGQVHLLFMDMTNPTQIQAAIDQIKTKHDHLDILINNAGCGLLGFFEENEDAQIRQVMETNFFGALALTRAALPLLRKAPEAKIINVSSIAGRIGFPYIGIYSASKWALEGWSESLQKELVNTNIRISLIEPGSFGTGFSSRASYCEDNTQLFGQLPNQLRTRVWQRKRKQNPQAVAHKIRQVIEKRSPRLRYLVGLDAYAFVWFKRLVPRSLEHWLLKTFFAKI